MEFVNKLAKKISNNIEEQEKIAKQFDSSPEAFKAELERLTPKHKFWSRVFGVFIILLSFVFLYFHYTVISNADDIYVVMLIIPLLGYVLFALGLLIIYYGTLSISSTKRLQSSIFLITFLESVIYFFVSYVLSGHFVLNAFISFILFFATIGTYFKYRTIK